MSTELPIPSCLSDVTADWVAELLYSVVGVPRPDNVDGTHGGITMLQARNCVGGHCIFSKQD